MNTPSDTQPYAFDRSGESITVTAHSLREAIFKAAIEPPSTPSGYATGPDKWEIWPLLMALGFICMAKNVSMGEFYLRALSIVFLTYSISHRLCKRA